MMAMVAMMCNIFIFAQTPNPIPYAHYDCCR